MAGSVDMGGRQGTTFFTGQVLPLLILCCIFSSAIDSLSVQPSDLDPATYFYLELFYLLLCCLSASCTNSVTYRMPMMNHLIALVPGLPCIGMHILISCTLTNCHVPTIHFLSDLQITSKVKASCYFATLYCMPFPDISYNQHHQKE